ncbi:MAG: class I SAM-dependent methyltransferase [Erythrobacter sp.]
MRMLAPVLPEGGRVLDLGGGDGRLAAALAGAGMSVTLVDSDRAMLDAAHTSLRARGMADRVTLIEGDAARCRLTGFDLVCCHSVLMYQQDAGPMLDACVAACRPAGAISIISLNGGASAMRAGLQQRWPSALAALQGRPLPDEAPVYDHSREACCAHLAARGCDAEAWFGLGIFTDHLRGPICMSEEEHDLAVAVETLAGTVDPYRGIARCWHVVARRQVSAGKRARRSPRSASRRNSIAGP